MEAGCYGSGLPCFSQRNLILYTQHSPKLHWPFNLANWRWILNPSFPLKRCKGCLKYLLSTLSFTSWTTFFGFLPLISLLEQSSLMLIVSWYRLFLPVCIFQCCISFDDFLLKVSNLPIFTDLCNTSQFGSPVILINTNSFFLFFSFFFWLMNEDIWRLLDSKLLADIPPLENSLNVTHFHLVSHSANSPADGF